MSLFFIRRLITVTAILSLTSCSTEATQTLVTIADARVDKAVFIDIGEKGDSAGDILIFDQPLLNENGASVGNNSGSCVRTRVAHSFQCQWTLTFEKGTIQVAGREHDQGTSLIAIVGGTGSYMGIKGQMKSVNNNDGTFTQTLKFKINE